MKHAARGALMFLVPVLMMWVLFTAQLVTPSRSPHPVEASTPRQSDRSTFPGDDQTDNDDADGTVDLYGNEVTDAVAKYKLDATGSLYELHSPQTELPRPRSPRS